jgi:8-oxo-dGTP pyrophosphatase MutT (NUDIX family)
MIDKVCPVIIRRREGLEVLAFRHPIAGLQLVKGTIEAGEKPPDAALRELIEESGLSGRNPREICRANIDGQMWHFVSVDVHEPAEQWTHHCNDDGGHDFLFFRQRLDVEPMDGWHESFRRALAVVRSSVAN